jgi:DNA-binding IclR family transcriptional regulator
MDGRYYAAEKLVHIASQIDTPYKRLELLAADEMRKLHDQYDENVLLAVLNSYRLQFISTLQSTRNIQILNNDDRSFVPHVTAAGKAILAYLPEKLLDAYYANAVFRKYTDKTTTDLKAIAEELAEVKQKGYAINRGEYEAEIMAVAAPIFHGEAIEGSLIVQFPTFRYRESELDAQGRTIMAAAKRVSKRLHAELSEHQ